MSSKLLTTYAVWFEVSLCSVSLYTKDVSRSTIYVSGLCQKSTHFYVHTGVEPQRIILKYGIAKSACLNLDYLFILIALFYRAP